MIKGNMKKRKKKHHRLILRCIFYGIFLSFSAIIPSREDGFCKKPSRGKEREDAGCAAACAVLFRHGRTIMNITLPCAILVSFRTYVFDLSMLLLTAAGFLSAVLMFILGYLISLKKGRDERIFYMLNMGAYNIGNFTLPFVSGFLGAAGTVATCLFDMGNAVMCVGGNLVFTQIAVDGKREGKGIVRSLLVVFTKPSFTVYVIMMILALIGIRSHVRIHLRQGKHQGSCHSDCAPSSPVGCDRIFFLQLHIFPV